jgi:hypothetical protein
VNAARNRAANRLTHVVNTISFANGSGCIFSAISGYPTLVREAREVSVLAATLISGIRSHGPAVWNSYEPLQSSGKAPDGYADEIWPIGGVGSKVYILLFRQHCLVVVLCIHNYDIFLCINSGRAESEQSRD